MWMDVVTLNRQISATVYKKIYFFREEVASFLLEAASREQKQLDVHCVKGERIPVSPHLKKQTKEGKDHMCLAS